MNGSNTQIFFTSFANTCRVCLSLQDDLVPISEIYFSHLNKNGSLQGVNVSDVFKKYCNVQMHDNDSKPSKLCRSCIGMVYRAYSIFEKFLESEEILDSLIGQHKPRESVLDSEIEETLADFSQDHLNTKNPPEESLIESAGEDESAGSPEASRGSLEHEGISEYEQDLMMLENDENEKDNSEVSHTQDNFIEWSETLSTQSEAKAVYSLDEKPCLSFNSTADGIECAQYSPKNHNSSEDDKSEFIIIIPDKKKSNLGESKSFIKILDKNLANSDDKKYVDVKPKARVWDHTYSRKGNRDLKNITNKRIRKKLRSATNKSNTVRRSRPPAQKFSEFKCNACENAQFDDIAKVIEHIKEIHPTLKKCIMCPRVLSHPEYMIIHVASHSEFGRFTCRKCLLVFKSEEALQNHKDSTKHKTPFSCNICGKLFTLRATWRVHNQVIHKKGTKHFFQCWVCGLVLKWARNYKGHLRSHKIYPRDTSHLCEFCAKGFYCNSSLTKHIMAVHKKVGKSRGDAENTLRTREAENTTEYKCDYCPKTFTSSGSHFAHRISHPECDNIECRYCEEVFSSLKDYKEHKTLEHSSFICDVCKKGFPSKERLGAHVSLHKGNFKCKFCDASFKTGQRRKIHEYVHTNERPHQCKICGSRFKQMTHLARHIECLHTEKRFICNQCGRRCQFESSYKNHLRSHTGVKPFLCPYCLKDFRDTIVRHRHVKREHPEMFQDFLLYKKEHQGEEVKRVEAQSDTFNAVFLKEEEETMFSALLSTEDEDNTLE